jgi:hypothetical protein
MASPVAPVTALTPCGRLRCLGVRALCRSGRWWLAEVRHRARCRRARRRPHTGSGGRTAPASRPTVCSRCRHGPAWTSRLGRPFIGCPGGGSTRQTSHPRPSHSSPSGRPETPGDASATVVRPHLAHPCALAAPSTVAAPRVRRVTGGDGDIRGFSAHVETRRVQVDRRPVGWASRRGAGRRQLALRPAHRHEHPGHRPRPGGRERRRGRTLPHESRSRPVTTGVATRSRDHPPQRAHRTRASPASHGPRPRRSRPPSAPQCLAVARPRRGINTLRRVRRCPDWRAIAPL